MRPQLLPRLTGLHESRNRDLQALLYGMPPKGTEDPKEARRRSAAVSRKLRMPQAHGILEKQPHTHRYLVTDHGRRQINAILSADRATTQQLTGLAA